MSAGKIPQSSTGKLKRFSASADTTLRGKLLKNSDAFVADAACCRCGNTCSGRVTDYVTAATSGIVWCSCAFLGTFGGNSWYVTISGTGDLTFDDVPLSNRTDCIYSKQIHLSDTSLIATQWLDAGCTVPQGSPISFDLRVDVSLGTERYIPELYLINTNRGGISSQFGIFTTGGSVTPLTTCQSSYTAANGLTGCGGSGVVARSGTLTVTRKCPAT